MRSIIIDAKSRTVREGQFDEDGSYAHIKAALHGATMTTAGRRDFKATGQEDMMFVDDEGLLKPELVDCFYLPLFYPAPLVGDGIIVGMDEVGDTVGCTTTVAEVEASIRWLTKSQIADDTWRAMATTTVSAVSADGTERVVGTIEIDRDNPDPNHPAKVAAMVGDNIIKP